MRFKKKVKFNDKTLRKEYLAFLSPLSLLLSFLSIAIDIPDKYKWVAFMSIIILFIILYISFWVKANLQERTELTINNSTVEIKVGDIFTEPELKVIAFNEYFDTQVDNKIISESSLNGIYIKNKIQDVAELDRKMEQDDHLNSEDIKIGRNENRRQGKKDKYKLGTIFQHDDFLLTAFSKFDSKNRAHLHMNDYVNFLMNFWNEVDIVYNGRSISIPLLGTGITRFKGYDMITEQELLELLIWSFKITKIKFNYPSAVTIVIHDSLKDKIDFYKLKELANGI
ncbi:macro domain-containing protein [Robertmurraya beringensis]|uniref:Macro domain-containing protein n=1 Tax=Robertmurraya beringensis TaxID=641660 RepID=A0ABV6KTC0_9BACI